MDRRKFFGIGVAALAAGIVSVLGGCGKTGVTPGADGRQMRSQGNQERLWEMVDGTEKLNEPVEIAYAKNTPAMYRDASFGKEDPSFKAKVGGG